MGSQGQYEVTSRVGLGMPGKDQHPTSLILVIHDMERRGGWGSFWATVAVLLADDASMFLDLARMV